MPYASAKDGTALYFERFHGDGTRARPETILLLMGLGANGRIWAPIVRRLVARGYGVLTTDNRGCGCSETPWRPWTTRTMAADAVAVLDAAGERRVHVIGASMGGMVAQELALEFPERVRTLVLGCTTGGFPRLDLAPRRGLVEVLRAAFGAGRPPRALEDRVRQFLRFAVSPDFAAACPPGSEAWDAVEAMLEDPMTQRGFVQQTLAALRHGSWSRLGQLQMPVQVQHGSADRVMPFEAGRELARCIPHARFDAIEGAGHALGLERPDEIFERSMDFLDAAAVAA